MLPHSTARSIDFADYLVLAWLTSSPAAFVGALGLSWKTRIRYTRAPTITGRCTAPSGPRTAIHSKTAFGHKEMEVQRRAGELHTPRSRVVASGGSRTLCLPGVERRE